MSNIGSLPNFETESMTMPKISVCPSNSLIFISDVEEEETPLTVPPHKIWSTPSCIAVGTLPEPDGDTNVTLEPFQEHEAGPNPVFDGMLDTPTGQVFVSVVDRSILLEGRSGTVRTRIRVWTNDPMFPDEIVIAYGE